MIAARPSAGTELGLQTGLGIDYRLRATSSRWKWHMQGGYAIRYEKKKLIFMHRQIAQPPRGMVVDHKNRKERDKYFAQIYHHNEQFYLGLFDKETDAARAYDQRAIELFGEFARVNFSEEWPPDRRREVHAPSDERRETSDAPAVALDHSLCALCSLWQKTKKIVLGPQRAQRPQRNQRKPLNRLKHKRGPDPVPPTAKAQKSRMSPFCPRMLMCLLHAFVAH